jgi:hypothetical protein
MQTGIFSRLGVLLVILALMMVGITATAQEAITPGTPVAGEYTGDDVSYDLKASAGQLLIISLESEDFDTRVGIRSGDMELASDDDGGGGSNSLLAYVVQEDGSYTVTVGAFFFDADTGAFTLNVDVVDPTIVDMDGSVTLEPSAEGSMNLYAVFNGAAGDVVDITARTVGEEEDIRIELYGTDAVSIDSDDDDGPGDDALLRRVVLPSDGLYLVAVRNSWSDTPMLEGVDVSVTSTEQLFLSPDDQALVLGDADGQVGTEVYTIDAEEGVTYTFFVTIESMPDDDVGISIEILDSNFFFDPVLETRHMTAVAWSWLSNTTGQVRLDVHPNFFGTDIEVINYTISMESE